MSDGKCKHCGQETQDITHVLWQCPAINKHRKIHDLGQIDPDLLPNYIKHGVPKAMTSNVEATYWGDTEEEALLNKPQDAHSNPITNETKQQIGLQSNNHYKTIASCKNQEVKDFMKTVDLDHKIHNARQCFEAVKATKGQPHMPLPFRCRRAPPPDINVYTDGSWIYPLKQFLGIGGAGVWWPGRDPRVSHRLSQAEKELAHYQQNEKGLMLYTPIGGYTGSSTRTELAAALIAISANGPTHIGTDSQAFVTKLTKLYGT